MVFEKQETMTSREKILSRVKSNQPAIEANELIRFSPVVNFDLLTKFKETLISIGGSIIEIKSESEIAAKIKEVIASTPNPNTIGPDQLIPSSVPPHSFQNIDMAILRGEFAVAENGAIWITDKAMIDRSLPFICSHLALIVLKSSLLATMHDAYERIGTSVYGLGSFIAGPSKTADIEQSLVLGAHGAKTLTCFLVMEG
jgi:L-lactate dehydrogenase complex protein LldG